MTEHRTDPLDDAIRSLVSRAVADAPPAPVIDERTTSDARVVRTIGSAPSARDRWIVGGVAALTTAAAVIAIALVARPDSAEAPAPATLPSATVPITVPTTVPAGTTPVPATTDPGVATGTAPPTPAPTAPPSTIAAPPDLTEVIVVAGDDGIQVDTGASLTDTPMNRPVQVALRAGDGVVYFQLRGEPLIQTNTPDVGLGQVDLPADFPGEAILHDAAVVDGEVVLLVESTPGNCVGPDGCVGSVWAVWPDRGEGVMLDEQNVWEAAWSRLSLADTGVTVGMFSAEVSVSPWSRVLPGVTATPFDPTTVGLDEAYSDCSTCPTALTIDRSGRFVGWIDRSDDGTTTWIVVAHLLDGAAVEYEVADSSAPLLSMSLDIGRLEIADMVFGSATAIVNPTDPLSADAAVVFDLLQPGREPIVIGEPASRMAFGT